MAATHSLDSHDGRPRRTGRPRIRVPKASSPEASGQATVSPVPVSVNQTGQRPAPRRRAEASTGLVASISWVQVAQPGLRRHQVGEDLRPFAQRLSKVVSRAGSDPRQSRSRDQQHDGIESVVEPSLVGHAARDVERPLAVGGQELDDRSSRHTHSPSRSSFQPGSSVSTTGKPRSASSRRAVDLPVPDMPVTRIRCTTWSS